jgi:MoaA/NifB/PqqE/SkfB family radical SAM enzyme
LNKTTLPRFLTYTVTFTCNAKCIMCDSWKIESKDDLSVDEVAEIFDELPTMDAVRLTGGEPFVRPDFPELVRLADQKLRPKALQITTNGFLTKRIVQFCEERRKKTPLYLLVSIDGVADKHNEIRGHSSAYKFALDTVTQLARRQKELNIATYSVERHIDVAPTEVGQFAAFGQIDNSILEDLIAEIDRDLARFPLLDRLAKRYYLRGIANRMIGRQGAPNPKCVALNTHMRLFPNGDVPTCQFNSKIVGNLRRQSFRDVWRSAAALHQRDWVQKCPGCWAECEVLPSAIYTLDLLTDSIRRLATPAPRPKIPVDVTP